MSAPPKSEATPTSPSASPATAQPGFPLWECHFADAANGGGKLDNLTVGTTFALTCKGDIAVEWDQTLPHVAFPKEEDTFSLVILGAEKIDAKEAVFEVTGYKPGEHKPEYLRVVQGERGFETDKPAWTIKSVIPPQSKPQPFGPYGPFGLPLPHWVLVPIALVLALVVFGLWRLIRGWRRRRQVRELLTTHRAPLPPAHQFYRDARGLRRRLHVAVEPADLKTILVELDRDLRLFLLRQFEILALEGSESVLLQDLERAHRAVATAVGPELKSVLRELARLPLRETIVNADVEQLHRMAVAAVEALERAAGADAKKTGRA